VDPSAGPVQRFAWELRRLRRDGGAPTYRAMAARVAYSAPALSQAAAGERLPSLPVALAYVRACGGDPDDWTRRWHRAAREVADNGEDSPFPGAEPFETADAGRFFGRDRIVADLAELTGRYRFVVLAGPSGCGKTSLLRAGLVPRLTGPVREITPGGRCPADWRGTLLVDRLEAVPGLRAADRAAFLAFLESARRPDRGLRVVVAVRADHAEHPDLAALIRGPRLDIHPPGPGELREMIVKPAVAEGLIVERTLTATLVEELAGEPGGPALLAPVLRETWRRRRGRSLTMDGYRAAGEMCGILAAAAENLYAELDPDAATTARCLLQRLVTPGAGTPDTCRAAARHELADVPPAVLDRLAAARLITVTGDAVRLSHPKLVTAWPRLRGWLEHDRDRLRFLRELTDATAEWERLGRDPGALFRGIRLTRARTWMARGTGRGELTPAERAFLRHSVRADDLESALNRRRVRRVRALAVATTVLLICAVAGVTIAVREQSHASDKSRLALSRQLAAQAQTAAAGDVAEAARYALDAIRAYPSAEARSALLTLAGRPSYHAQFAVPFGHPAELAVSPRGDLLAARDPQRGVLLADPRTLAPLGALPDSTAAIQGPEAGQPAISFSGDGKLLATGSGSGRVVVWDVGTRTPTARLVPHQPGATAAALSPAGDLLATSGEDGRLRLWNPAGGTERGALPGTDWTPASLRFSPDGRLLVGSKRDGSLVLWDVPARRVAARLTLNRGALPGAAFSPDSRLLATADGATVVLWDTTTFQPLSRLAATGTHLTFVPGRPTMLAVGRDTELVLWDIETPQTEPQQPVATLSAGIPNAVHGLAASPDGRTILAATDSAVLGWQRDWLPLLGHTGPVTDVAVDRRRGRTVSTGADQLLRTWNPRGESVSSPHAETLTHQVLSRDGTRLATVGSDGTIAVRDTADTAQPVAVVPGGGSERYLAIALSPDGRLAAVAGYQGITIWDVSTSQPVRRYALAFQALSLAFSPDGRHLLAGYVDVAVWDTTSWTVSARYSGSATPALGVAAGPDARQVAAIGADGVVAVWDAARPAEPVRLRGLNGQVRAVAFSPDGRLLAAGGDDRMVAVWETSTREPWASLTGHRARINALAWSPDGNTLLSASSDNTITRWPVNPAAAAARLCQALRTGFPPGPPLPAGCG
jgi:WD40 repeat protein